MPRTLSFRNRLLLWVMPTLVLGMLSLTVLTYRHIHGVIESELTRSMLAATGKSAESIETWLRTLLLEPETIAATPAAMGINRDFGLIDRQNVFRYRFLHEKHPDLFQDIYAANRDGDYHTVQYDERRGLSFFRGNIRDREYFRSIMAGGPPQVTPPLISRTFKVPTLFVVAPIKGVDGRPQGLIGAGISLDYVRKVAESLTAGRTGYGFILAHDGTFISHPNRTFVMTRRISDLGQASVTELGRAMLAGGSGTFRYRFDGVEKIAFYQPVPLTGWSVATTLPVSELFEPATRLLKYMIFSTLLGAGGIALLIVLAAQHLTRPLGDLARNAELIGAGHLELRDLGIRSRDELGTLAAAFDAMAGQLKQTLETLGSSERRYRTLVDNLNIGICRIGPGPGGGFLQANPAMVKLFRYASLEAFLAVEPQALFQDPGQFGQLFRQLEQRGSVRDLEVAMGRKDGTALWCQVIATAQRDAGGRLEWVDGVFEDVSERRRLEEQLRQAQKMEAVGTLAGGVAHDFNNILTAIIGYASLSREAGAGDARLESFLDNILAASGKASRLTQSLLAFSRKQVMTLRPVDLNEIIRKMEKLLLMVVGEDIEFRASLAAGDLPIVADGGQIEQVLVNLAINARDAMPEGGTLSIATARVDLQGAEALLPLASGQYALVTVADSGHGMDEPTRQRIFEPFFTTKAVGKGTGLGLSIVSGIVKQHGGEIIVYSEPGAGTTFRIYLKCDGAPAGPEPERRPGPPPGGSETILLAEDDGMVREVYQAVLEKAGYRVIAAVDGVDAVEKFTQAAGAVDLLILDVVMPRLNGKEVCDAVRSRQPGAKVLFSSGYTREIIQMKKVFEEGVRFISKPASPVELLDTVRKTIDSV